MKTVLQVDGDKPVLLTLGVRPKGMGYSVRTASFAIAVGSAPSLGDHRQPQSKAV